MKKYISILLITLITVFCLTGCGKKNASKSNSFDQSKKQIKIVTTIFPEYDWVKEILGDKSSQVDMKMLLDQGVDLHSYQPTAEDIMKISDCDLFIYVGGESDEWVEDALKKAVNKNMKVIKLMDVLGDRAKEETVVKGMQADEEKHEHDKKEEKEYDEHVWVSLKNTKLFCNAIEKALVEIDVDNAKTYKKNAEQYEQKLQKLDKEYQAAVDASSHKTLLFGDRFPFRYLADDYGFDYYAAFPGCSAETEASFKTITFLAQKVDKIGLKNIMTIEKSDQKVAKTIRKNTKKKNQKILALDSMQSITSKDIKNGVTYLSVMEKNLQTLKKALQ